MDLPAGSRVLEIGSAEGGNLRPFAEAGYVCTGIELSAPRIELATEFCKNEIKNGKIRFIQANIFDVKIPREEDQKYDLVFLKDVLEHIHDQDKFMHRLPRLLKQGGHVFLGFPSWFMPFGGHQQMCYNKFLARMPFFHLLPMWAYQKILKWLNKNERQNEGLIEIKKTGISIHRFETILRKEQYHIVHRQFYFVPPIYKYKFGLKVRKLPSLIGAIPLLREFFITSAYYLIQHTNHTKS